MAIPLAAFAAIPGLLSGGYKAFAGAKQVKDGKEMAKNNIFQKYRRPEEVQQALRLAEQQYRNGMPGTSLLENRIKSGAAMAMDASMQGASSSGDVLDAASRIGANTNTSMQDLALQEAAYKDKAMAGYTQQLQNSAGYADKEFQYNVAQPYERTAAAASALIGAGNTNVFAGVDEGMGSITDAIRMAAEDEWDGTGSAPGRPRQVTARAGSAGVTQTSGGNMPSGNPVAGSPFVTQPSALQPNKAFANPALSGKWVVDPRSGAQRWVAS